MCLRNLFGNDCNSTVCILFIIVLLLLSDCSNCNN